MGRRGARSAHGPGHGASAPAPTRSGFSPGSPSRRTVMWTTGCGGALAAATTDSNGPDLLGRAVQVLEELAEFPADGAACDRGGVAPAGVQALLGVEESTPVRTARNRDGAQELDVFQAVLGEDVEVNRTEHIVAGARRCAYRVCPSGARVSSGFFETSGCSRSGPTCV